jgi:hypothetical protein
MLRKQECVFQDFTLADKELSTQNSDEIFGNRATTCTFSNLGRISAPKEFKDKVLRYDFNLGPQPTVLTSVCSASYNDCMSLTFARVIEESGVEKRFFKILTSLGITVALESDRVEE